MGKKREKGDVEKMLNPLSGHTSPIQTDFLKANQLLRRGAQDGPPFKLVGYVALNARWATGLEGKKRRFGGGEEERGGGE